MKRKSFLPVLLLIIAFSDSLQAQKKFYWNPAGDNKASNASNWHLGGCNGTTGLPAKNDTMFFSNCGASNPNCTVDITFNVAQIELTSSYTGIVSMNAGKKLTFKNGKFSGGTFIGKGGALNANKSLTIEGCNFTSSSGTLTIKGPFTYSSGNFSHNNGKVVFNKGSLTNSSAGILDLYDLEFQGAGSDFTVNGTVSIHHTLSTTQTLNVRINSGGGGGTLELYGDLKWDNTAASFGNVVWKFSGSNAQIFSGAIEPILYDVIIDKSDQQLLLQKGFSVSHQLNLQNGFITSDSSHAVTILSGATVINASPNSFVRGAIRKIGNTSFQFPIGIGLKYRPAEISAPASAGDAFLAQYHHGAQAFGDNKDPALTYLSRCEYWNLSRTAGTSSVTLKLFWDELTCDIDTVSTLCIARWNSSAGQWINTGMVSVNGDIETGSIATQTAQVSFGNFLIAKSSPLPIVSAGNDTTVCAGASLVLGGNPVASGGTPPLRYSWSPVLYLDTLFRDHPIAILHNTIDYVLTVTDADDVVVTDTIHITVNTPPTVNAGYDRFVLPGSSTTLGSVTPASGGTPPYNYIWSPPTGLNQTTITQPVSIPQGNISYKLTATDAQGCVANDMVNVLMNVPSTGKAGMFGLLAGDSIQFTNAALVSARVGSRKFVSAAITSDDSIVVKSALDSIAMVDLTNAINQIKALSGTVISSTLGGITLTSGSYIANGNATLSGTLTLQGNSESIFIININDSLTVNSGGSIVLDGVNRSQVYLRIGGNLRVSGTSSLPCNILVEKNIFGGTINNASLLCAGKIKISKGDVKPGIYAATLTSVTRTDAGEFFGLNGNNFTLVSQIYPSHLSDQNDRLHMPQLNTRIVRWPAGGKAKSWNTNDGWWLDPDEVTDSLQYIFSPNLPCIDFEPNDAAANRKLPVNRLLDLRFQLGGSDAKLLLVLNMFTRKEFQLGVMQQAVDLNINFPYIEMGNEFYLKGGTCPWPQPEDYAAEVNSWLSTIHSTPALAGKKVGIVGSSWTTESGVTDETDCRRKAWNASVLPNLTGTQPGDAITFHIYPMTGIAGSKAPKVTLADVPTIFKTAFTEMDDFSNHELKTLKDYPNLDAWITEYNLTDKSFIIHGSWADAMYLSILTMRLLEFPEVKLALCHTFAIDAGRGLFFTDATGYRLGEEWVSIDSLTQTEPWGLTAGGLAMKMITEAARFSTKATMVNFRHAPVISNSSYPVLYGWTFDKDLGDKQSVILNLSDQPLQIDISALQPAGAYEQISCKDPLYFITGKVYWEQPYNDFYHAVSYDYNTALQTPSNFDSVQVKIPAGVTTIYLPPYSITRLYALNTSSVWFRKSASKVCAPDNNDYDTLHASTAVNIYASGGAYYEWSVGEPEKSTASSVSVSPALPLTNGTLKVFDPEGNLLGTKNNISVSHTALPTVVVTPSSFNNSLGSASFTATASGANNYSWLPSYGSGNIIGNSITITPPYSRTYSVIGTGSGKCSKIEKIATSISPMVSIHAQTGFPDKRVVPNKLNVCRGNSVTLIADGDADSYTWYSSDGSVNGTGTSITFTPSKNVLITLQATDHILQCTSKTSLFIMIIPEAFTDFDNYYYCANQFLKIHGQINNEGLIATYCWDDLQPGTMLYEKKNFSKPVAENVCKNGYSSVFFNAPAGDYTLQFKAQDPEKLNCTDVQNDFFFQVHLNNPPALTSPSGLCMINGGTVTLVATGDNNDFTWDGPGLQKSIGTSVEVSPVQTATYKVTSSNSLCCTSASVTVTVETVSANCDGSIYCYGCSGKQVHVAPFDPAHYGYQWYENGIAIAGATGGSYSVTVAGPQSVKQATVYCAVTKLDGTCAPGKTNEVKVTAALNCNYLRDADPDSESSSPSSFSQSIFIFPNPAKNNFTINFSEQNSKDEHALTEIYDLMGQLIWREEFKLTNGKFSEEFDQVLPVGMYLIRVCTSQGCESNRVVISSE